MFWRELPQVEFFVATKGPRLSIPIIGGSGHKYIIFVATKVLSRQNTSFVATKVCLSRQNQVLAGAATSIIFVATKVIATNTFVATKHVFCRDKSMFLATKLLSRQAYFCLDKRRVCRDRKMILVAAPANDTSEPLGTLRAVRSVCDRSERLSFEGCIATMSVCKNSYWRQLAVTVCSVRCMTGRPGL